MMTSDGSALYDKVCEPERRFSENEQLGVITVCVKRTNESNCRQLVTVHRIDNQNMSANSSVFTGRHLHRAALSAVPPTQYTHLLEMSVTTTHS